MLVGCQEAIVEEVPEVVEEIEEIEVAEPVVEEVCIPNWVCDNWGSCENETKSRTCADANSCGVDTDKPVESESCVACGDGVCSEGEDYELCSSDCKGIRDNLLNATLEELVPENFNVIEVTSEEIPQEDMNPKQLSSTQYYGRTYHAETSRIKPHRYANENRIMSIRVVQGKKYNEIREELSMSMSVKNTFHKDVNYLIDWEPGKEPTTDKKYLEYCWTPEYEGHDYYDPITRKQHYFDDYSRVFINLPERDAFVYITFSRCGNIVGAKDIMKEYFSNFE